MSIRKAVILAAGLGKRMWPMTKAVPKPLLPLIDRPIIDHIIEEARASGIEEIAVVVHFQKEVIIKHLADEQQIQIIIQPELNGTAAALKAAEAFIDHEPFALLLGDEVVQSRTPCLQQLMDVFQLDQAKLVTGVEQTTQEKISAYNTLACDEWGRQILRITEIVEKPIHPISLYTSIGRYILSPVIFEYLPDHLLLCKRDEIPLTESFNTLVEQHLALGYLFEGRRFDLGNKKDWLYANQHY
ncbi:UTP--glucose-1-phosphate uridylyltransferase [Pullulanibacillus camelliae]|uniref:UTP--glucose-1-phosphate uridylyltransferase n=1 Tax=Pullulanibacillus camelliae TaxID=1707096 RepID=A0A8J2YDM7_9BACL|nr:sugar phosphate nucleotidyltransferase [Pullulanibacillus camelliae]GGE40489.1 UTP--glucose-1-phosphate uridylyltransferase [Pullulanibacillus camelliae]